MTAGSEGAAGRRLVRRGCARAGREVKAREAVAAAIPLVAAPEAERARNLLTSSARLATSRGSRSPLRPSLLRPSVAHARLGAQRRAVVRAPRVPAASAHPASVAPWWSS
eukprot:4545446-Alexandrium_andersonii.AAC.1